MGYYSGANETGSHKLYIENSGADSANSLIYGEFDNSILMLNADVTTKQAYTLPTADGSNLQLMSTNGSGSLGWRTITEESTTSSNGLTLSGSDVKLGGSLSSATTVDLNSYNMNFNFESRGNFRVRKNSRTFFLLAVQGKLEWDQQLRIIFSK